MRTLGKLLIRLLSLYIFVRAILSLKDIIIFLIPQLGEEKLNALVIESGILKYLILHFLITLLLGVVLWMFADNIISLMLGKYEEEHIMFNIQYDELLSIALTILGIILAINAIPDLITKVSNYLSANIKTFDLHMRSAMLIEFTEPILRLVVGIYLIFRNKPSKNDSKNKTNRG